MHTSAGQGLLDFTRSLAAEGAKGNQIPALRLLQASAGARERSTNLLPTATVCTLYVFVPPATHTHTLGSGQVTGCEMDLTSGDTGRYSTPRSAPATPLLLPPVHVPLSFSLLHSTPPPPPHPSPLCRTTTTTTFGPLLVPCVCV